MQNSKQLDYFKTKVYNKYEVSDVEKFMNYNFNVNKIILACFVPAGTGDAYHKDRPSHGLAIHLDGEKEYVFDSGKILIVKKGDIIYLPKNSTYKVTSFEVGDCYAINFNISEEIAFEPFVIKAKNTAGFKNYFESAEKAWSQKKSGFEMKCKAELYNVLYALVEEYNLEYISKNKFEIIRPAVEFIHNNYTKMLLNVSELSMMCNITPEYFRDIFHRNFGTSPIKYINNLKITRAKELLSAGFYSVGSVAEMSGYSDISHFSREFKKATGVSPSEFK